VSNQTTDAPTPEHNSIQIKFLDADFCNSFIKRLHNVDLSAIFDKYTDEVATLTEKAKMIVDEEKDWSVSKYKTTGTRYSLELYNKTYAYLDFKFDQKPYSITFEAQNGADVIINKSEFVEFGGDGYCFRRDKFLEEDFFSRVFPSLERLENASQQDRNRIHVDLSSTVCQ
jgi:hypothetical protein